METDLDFIPFEGERFLEVDMLKKSQEFYEWANTRRSVRDFSSKEVPVEIMNNLIMTASTAPSGAHKQPWTFCLISNKALKSKLRTLAEEEEFISYNSRMSEEWKNDLTPLGTNWEKEFIDIAPWIVVVMKKVYDIGESEEKQTNYYVAESVGIAVGMLLLAVHNVGLVALTHTPSPMNFIAKVLNRPKNERPFLLIPIGYPAENASIPNLKRKGKKQVIELYE